MYNILGVNPGHHGSVTVVSDGEVVLYIEEERLSRFKYDANPFLGVAKALDRYRIDELVLGGTDPNFSRLCYTNEDPYSALVRKLLRKFTITPERNIEFAKVVNMASAHHLGHAAAAFYNSGFKTAAAVVVDGAGSGHLTLPHQNGPRLEGYETESIYECAYPNRFTSVYKSYAANDCAEFVDGFIRFGNSVTITKVYEAVSDYLGFGYIEAGKTMGLAPYGEPDARIPDLFVNGRGNKSLFIPRYPNGAEIDLARHPALSQGGRPTAWHRDASLVTPLAKNLAWKAQMETQRSVGDLIELAVERTGENNIVIAGGYGLNCVANYYFLDRFKDLNFYIDPMSHDGGTSLGIALFQWYTREAELRKGRDWSNYSRERIRTICLGPEPSNTYELVDMLDDFEVEEAAGRDAARLLAQGNIVAIFSGRSEAGPRALGNRSILFDARIPDGKDLVNTVKGREWFRPFAASVLHEHAAEWFDLRTIDESPFMMFAVDVWDHKRKAIPAVTHVDGTCRVQTVKQEQNPHFYDLIAAFNALTGCPLVLNTSFNLAGEPLVESLADAIETVRNSAMRYLYLPDIGKILVKRLDSSSPSSLH